MAVAVCKNAGIGIKQCGNTSGLAYREIEGPDILYQQKIRAARYSRVLRVSCIFLTYSECISRNLRYFHKLFYEHQPATTRTKPRIQFPEHSLDIWFEAFLY